jgi:hypothetical protein
MPVPLMERMFFARQANPTLEEEIPWDRLNKPTSGMVFKSNIYRSLTFNSKMSSHHQEIVMACLGLNYLQNVDSRQWQNAELAAGELVTISYTTV